ncbi:MAG: exopolysaccharide biosynthesis protein [Alphaproteobacteria bacterium]
MKNLRLADILNEMDKDAKDGKLNLGDMIERLNTRGFGPLLLATGFIAVLPTGAIPGVSTLVALLVILIAFQILIGWSSPWIPERLRAINFPQSYFEKGKDKLMPAAKAIDRLIQPRLQFLTSGIAIRIIAVICVGIALSMPFLGLIPFALLIPGLAIVFFGLGLSAHDGLLILIALAFTAGSVLFMT